MSVAKRLRRWVRRRVGPDGGAGPDGTGDGHADWSWRPEAWTRPLPDPARAGPSSRTAFGAGLTLFHDCPLADIELRQESGDDGAGHSVVLEVGAFEGAYLSFVLDLPGAAVGALRGSDIVTADIRIVADRPCDIQARLNLRRGPNVAQFVDALEAADGAARAEFDLGHAGVDDRRVDAAWVDIILDAPGGRRIRFADVVLGRHPRAAF